jgi:RNA polymerase sigma-70 factor (ECF subfamily)
VAADFRGDLRVAVAEDVDVALDMLSPNHKAILILRESEGLSYDEISRVLRIPKGTVMSRLFHARMRLQRECAKLAVGAVG